jgi:nucleotide-binding universal stress UspA family protein
MYPRILVPVDGSAASSRALHEAAALAHALGSALVLLNVVDTYQLLLAKTNPAEYDAARESLRRHGQELLEAARLTAEGAGVASHGLLREVMSSRVSGAIVEEARRHRCNLIVMGTHGRNGRTRLPLGSDAERVVRAAKMPVLLVQQDEPAA